ncbi:hypothetical protein OZX74_02440 [Bifidobacterium sp. ESL0798]|uniref:hypothetical protein n=1 Tax=unclassified Bifidobacterium TaxID=2608897 RepID=UPI0023F958A4|nr:MULTISPECIES: hypothetical protein [unclassified Bifidobacterium]WEV52612.1 hypothetical protein OZX64_06965 [Bifidobacterium sp. ESL0704]WEV74420.1 hypothetical protein OZX74_02440 [Bifidobacterium sp. ESL0798]
MSTQQRYPSSSHGKLIAVVVAAAVVIVLALLSAFVWPGWAMNKGAGEEQKQQQITTAAKPEPTTPSIKAKELPQDATPLLKAMPDTVVNFARTEAAPSANWTSASPLEEYTLTYSTGNIAKDVTLVVAQWSGNDTAKTQYDTLTDALKGTDLASGDVKVSGNATGKYVVKADSDKSKTATAVWQNDTVVFQATGPKASIQRFYSKFPL